MGNMLVTLFVRVIALYLSAHEEELNLNLPGKDVACRGFAPSNLCPELALGMWKHL